MDSIDTAWIIHTHILGALGVGDLHSIEAACPILTKSARTERFRKNNMQLVVYTYLTEREVATVIRLKNLFFICQGMEGLRYSI